MTPHRKEFTVGDYVEVHKNQRIGLNVTDLIIKARVCWVDEYKVGVVYEDGNQEMFERRSGLVQRAAD